MVEENYNLQQTVIIYYVNELNEQKNYINVIILNGKRYQMNIMLYIITYNIPIQLNRYSNMLKLNE